MRTSPLREHHERSGARLAAPGEPVAVLTYGDVPAEYRAAHSGALVLDVSERGLVRVAGSDSEGFLHRILANAVKGLAPGEGNRNLLLTGKGKVVHAFDLARTGAATFELSTPPGDAERLVASLDTYLFSEDCALEDASDSHAPLEVIGPDALTLVERVAGVPPPERLHGETAVERNGRRLRMTLLHSAGFLGWRLDAGPGGVAELWDALVAGGARPGGLVAFDSLRAERGVGAFGRDVTEDVYPQEARLDDAFSLDKGCYIGQEVVAKIDTYGGLNKRLMALRVDDDDPVAPGTRLVRRDGGELRDLGVITTWAYSFALDTGLVLGYVKRKHQEEGTVFHLRAPDSERESTATATIVALPVA